MTHMTIDKQKVIDAVKAGIRFANDGNGTPFDTDEIANVTEAVFNGLADQIIQHVADAIANGERTDEYADAYDQMKGW